MRSGLSWKRGRPARKWAEGPQVFRRPTGVLKRARCPRSQGASTCLGKRKMRFAAGGHSKLRRGNRIV